MATTPFYEPGGDSDFGVAVWPVLVGTPTAVTDFVHGTHLRSIRHPPGGNEAVENNGILADSGGRVSFWVYFVAFGSATSSIANHNITGNAASVLRIRITTAGVLQVWDNTAQVGSNGATLATGQWYRLCLAWKLTSTTVNEIRLFVDGATSISITNATISHVNIDSLLIGNNSGNGTIDFRTSDHYIDASTTFTDPGNVWVTAKRPFSNGTTNGFTTQIGAGGSSYGSGHAPQVNERALSTTNGWSMIGVGSAVTEEYTIEGASVGDIDISRAYLIDYMGWVYAKSALAETAQIVVGGVSSNISLTSTNTTFVKTAGLTTYPAGGTDIGIVTATTATTVSLYECGVIFAYIPATFSKSLNVSQAVNRAGTY